MSGCVTSLKSATKTLKALQDTPKYFAERVYTRGFSGGNKLKVAAYQRREENVERMPPRTSLAGCSGTDGVGS
jgi:hypothetical protein